MFHIWAMADQLLKDGGQHIAYHIENSWELRLLEFFPFLLWEELFWLEDKSKQNLKAEMSEIYLQEMSLLIVDYKWIKVACHLYVHSMLQHYACTVEIVDFMPPGGRGADGQLNTIFHNLGDLQNVIIMHTVLWL